MKCAQYKFWKILECCKNKCYNQEEIGKITWLNTNWNGPSTLNYISSCDRSVKFSPGTPVSSTNKIDCHNITEILLTWKWH